MCEIMDELREESIEIGKELGKEIGKDTATVDHIKTIMESLKLTDLQAMDLLKIPADDQSRYMAMLK